MLITPLQQIVLQLITLPIGNKFNQLRQQI